MDAGPRPWSIYRRRMVVDLLRPHHSYNSVMDRNVNNRQQIRDPVLIKRQKGEHDEKVKVKLDIAAREMNQDGRGAHEPKPYRRRSNFPADGVPGCDAGKEGDDCSFRDRMEHGVLAKKGSRAKFPTIPKNRSNQSNQQSVKPGKSQQKSMPALPHVRRQGSPERKEIPETFEEPSQQRNIPEAVTTG